MIKSIHFKNFKALQDTTLQLSRFTLIVGPNGSGKSTAMQALFLASHSEDTRFFQLVTAGLPLADKECVAITINWALDEKAVDSSRRQPDSTRGVIEARPSQRTVKFITKWEHRNNRSIHEGLILESNNLSLPENLPIEIVNAIRSFRIFSFDAEQMAEPVLMLPSVQLEENGRGLAGVLENLRDSEPERFEALNEELGRWLPEFDRITFETPAQGQKVFQLRTRVGHNKIKAIDLSHGTLFALAFLTLAYIPHPPSIICFEEPERGIHPRLLREIRDAMYRLCYPEEFGDKRKPVQVIATTHSPYFLDLYKDYPEEVVIAHKDEHGVHFERLSEKPNITDFLQDAPLGEIWYSGILGGVPMKP